MSSEDVTNVVCFDLHLNLENAHVSKTTGTNYDTSLEACIVIRKQDKESFSIKIDLGNLRRRNCQENEPS